MDTIENFRQIIQQVLMEYTKIPYAYGQLQCKAIFDRESDSYLLVTVGWDGAKRVHGILVHLDIIDGKVWIQRDGTEYGIAYELERAGIARSCIVLGFHPPEVRSYTEYAVALEPTSNNRLQRDRSPVAVLPEREQAR